MLSNFSCLKLLILLAYIYTLIFSIECKMKESIKIFVIGVNDHRDGGEVAFFLSLNNFWFA